MGRIFSAGSIALIVLAGAVFWHFAPVWAAQPIIVNPISNQNATEDAAFNFQFAANTFEDPEHTLTYTAQLAGGGALPAWLSFDAVTRTLSGIPTSADVGTLSIDVIADDGNGGAVSDTFNIVIANANDAPYVANVIFTQNATEDAAFNFQFAANTFYDPDVGDTLTYTALSSGGGALPLWLSFDPATRTFSGTPLNSDVGVIDIDVIADDGNGGTVTETFNIYIANTYDAPTIASPIPDQTAAANNLLNFQFANTFETDPGNTPTFSAQLTGGGALPAWLEFGSTWQGQTFSGTPSNGDIGIISIDVTVDDGLGGTITDTLNIEVIAAAGYSGAGNGFDEASAFIITSCMQLQEMSNNLGAWYRLGNDIDCSDTVNWNSGAGFVPVGDPGAPFIGTLEGAGYAISGLTINRPSTDYVGLFGYGGLYTVGSAARQFMLEDVSIRGRDYVGSVFGHNAGSISEIGITGEVNGVHIVGGAVGRNNGFVSGLYSHAAISGVPGSGVGGGLVGENGGFTARSYSTGAVPNGSGKGGLIGDDLGSGGVSSAFWDTQTSGNATSDQGTGKTTAELKNVATFTAAPVWPWDFVGNPNDDAADDDIWGIDPLINQGYPYLTALIPAVPDTSTMEPPASPTIASGTPRASPDRAVAVVVPLTPTSTQDVTTDDDTTQRDNPNPFAHTDNSNNNIKKTEATDTSFRSWVIGFSLIILIVATYFIYRRAHREDTK
jgi:hypothetical protein